MDATSDRPFRSERDQQLVLEDALEAHVLGKVQPDRAVVEDEEELGAKEGGDPLHQIVASRRRLLAVGGDGHVLWSAFVHRARRLQRCPSPPQLGDARVAGGGQRALTEVGPYPQRVFVAPAHRGLGLGQGEPVLDEGSLRGAELAVDDGVAAPAGQCQHAVAGVGLETGGALPHPGLCFLPSEGIDVEQRLPDGSLRPVRLEAGPAPDAALVPGVLPEVVEPLAPDRDVGNALVRVVDAPVGVVGLLELGHLFELGNGRRVASLDPGERILALDLLEPQVRVLGPRGISHGEQGQADRYGQRDQAHVSLRSMKLPGAGGPGLAQGMRRSP